MVSRSMSKFKWSYKFNYLLHLFLIVATLFVGYWIGNAWGIFDNAMNENPSVKIWGYLIMFLWFTLVLFLADNVWENVLKV